MIRTIIAAILLASTSAAHAVDKDMLCVQYQKLAERTKRQADEGYPLDLHLASVQKMERFDLIWIVKEVHRKDMAEFTPEQAGFIIWQACSSNNYPGASDE